MKPGTAFICLHSVIVLHSYSMLLSINFIKIRFMGCEKSHYISSWRQTLEQSALGCTTKWKCSMCILDHRQNQCSNKEKVSGCQMDNQVTTSGCPSKFLVVYTWNKVMVLNWIWLVLATDLWLSVGQLCQYFWLSGNFLGSHIVKK